MTNCNARPDRYGVMRCVACRVSWERDDVAACPRSEKREPEPASVVFQQERLVFVARPEKVPFASGLAPDYFSQGFK